MVSFSIGVKPAAADGASPQTEQGAPFNPNDVRMNVIDPDVRQRLLSNAPHLSHVVEKAAALGIGEVSPGASAIRCLTLHEKMAETSANHTLAA